MYIKINRFYDDDAPHPRVFFVKADELQFMCKDIIETATRPVVVFSVESAENAVEKHQVTSDAAMDDATALLKDLQARKDGITESAGSKDVFREGVEGVDAVFKALAEPREDFTADTRATADAGTLYHSN